MIKIYKIFNDCVILFQSEKATNRFMKIITKFIEKIKVVRPNIIKYLCYDFNL